MTVNSAGLVGYNGQFLLYNPWATDSSGYAPATFEGHPVWGLHWFSATDMSMNFYGRTYGTGTESGLEAIPTASSKDAGSSIPEAENGFNHLSTPPSEGVAGQSSSPDAHNGANGLANGAQTGPVSTDASIMAAVHAPQARLDRDPSTHRAAWDAFWAEVGPQNNLS